MKLVFAPDESDRNFMFVFASYDASGKGVFNTRPLAT